MLQSMRWLLPLFGCLVAPWTFGADHGMGTWNIRAFARVPATYPAPQFAEDGMDALFFEGPMYEGRQTRVFAYFGVPTVPAGTKVPAMVLVHGGGGTANPEWVRQWTARGYAAIAIDTGGNVPAKNEAGRMRHEWAGPVDGDASIAFGDRAHRLQWVHQAVADIMLAHSLLAAQPGIDAKKIGLMGLSWGGVLTAITAGVDLRFRVCVPVYGCGFLAEMEAFRDQLATGGGPAWSKLWDPRHFVGDATAPMLWVNGTNDRFFPLEQWQRTVLLQCGLRALLILPGLGHSEAEGRKPPEIGVFVDSILKRGTPLPVCGVPQRGQADVTVSVSSKMPIAHADLYFTRDSGAATKLKWETEPAKWDAAVGKVTALLPTGARRYFVSVTDTRDCTVTTQVSDFEP